MSNYKEMKQKAVITYYMMIMDAYIESCKGCQVPSAIPFDKLYVSQQRALVVAFEKSSIMLAARLCGIHSISDPVQYVAMSMNKNLVQEGHELKNFIL